MPNIHYRAGTAFERKVLGFLADRGMVVSRAAGSKGAGKMDLVAFTPDGRVLIIQCKQTGQIRPAEWNRLYEVAAWSMTEMGGGLRSWPVVPLVAMTGPRAKPGQPWTPRFMRLAEPKVPRSRTFPWIAYDVIHGCDISEATDRAA